MTTKVSKEHGEAPFIAIYDIVDGWYHEHTRHHLIDVDPNASNMIDKLVAWSDQRVREAYKRGYNSGQVAKGRKIKGIRITTDGLRKEFDQQLKELGEHKG